MKTIIHPADSRGYANLGWLETYYSFSFASYYNPYRMHFGALRVLNDDIIAGGMGFDMHPHHNMEIITIPLEGALTHKDSFGHEQTIRKGEIQVMSAGTGIYHSEYNASNTEPAKLFQIWILPERKDIKPRYEQKSFSMKKNKWVTLVSPTVEHALRINQRASIHIGQFDAKKEIHHTLMSKQHGVYLFIIQGQVSIETHLLHTRDALCISETEEITLQVKEPSEILLIDVPLYLS